MSKFVDRIVMESREKYDAVDFSPTAKLPKLDFHFNCAGASVGTMLPFNVFGYYLLYFYTDILGINPLTAANIIIFARVFDTFTDLMMGYAVDRSHFKAGKYRGWVILSILPQFFMFLAVFFVWPSEDHNTTWQIIWCWITYGAYGALCATLGYIPQNCQTQNMTRNEGERAKAASWKGIYENISILIAATCFLPVSRFFCDVTGNTTAGFLVTCLIFAVVSFFPVTLSGLRFTRKYELTYEGEYRPQLLVEEAPEKKVSIWVSLRDFITCRPVILTISGIAIMFALANVRSSMAVYLFEYYFELPEMTSISLGLNISLAIVGAFLVPYIIKLFKDTARAFIIMALVNGAVYGLLFLWIKTSPMDVVQESMHFGPMFWLYVGCGLFQGIYATFPMAIVPHTVDYARLKYDRNMSGFIYGVYGVMLTAGGAIGNWISGKMLASSGYVAGIAQSDNTLSTILFCGMAIPALFAVVHATFQMLAGVSDKKHLQWLAAIDARDAAELERTSASNE